jgi:hypothetical protein
MKSPAMVLFLVFIASFSSFSQELRYSDLNTDKRPKGSFRSYVSKDGTVYQIGDTLKIGLPSLGYSFDYIYVENGFLEIAGGQAIKPLDAAAGSKKLQIKKIWIKGTKKTGLYALLRSKGSMRLLSETYSIDLENAVEMGEIIKSLPSSDQALSEMKRPKE